MHTHAQLLTYVKLNEAARSALDSEAHADSTRSALKAHAHTHTHTELSTQETK